MPRRTGSRIAALIIDASCRLYVPQKPKILQILLRPMARGGGKRGATVRTPNRQPVCIRPVMSVREGRQGENRGWSVRSVPVRAYLLFSGVLCGTSAEDNASRRHYERGIRPSPLTGEGDACVAPTPESLHRHGRWV
jgi:hypothetical protein